MRKELKLIEQIEYYLLNTMSAANKAVFEMELSQDAALQKKVEFQQNLMAAIKQVGLRETAKKASKSYRFQKLMKQIGLGAIGALVIAGAAYYFIGGNEKPVDNSVEINQIITYPENDTLTADANKYLDQEVFTINTNQDTVIETEDGVVVNVPAGAFDTESERVDLVLQTAVQSDDILKAGLSTTSDGEELETGGMFYIDAYAENERVNLKKNLTVDIPAAAKKPGMQLYEGVKMSNGEINWVSPKPVETFLTAVDIEGLDFYPPGYETALDNWGLYGKAFRDSLYYSFALDGAGLDYCDQHLESGPPKRKITVEERLFLYGDDRPIDQLMTMEEANRLCEEGMFDVGLELPFGDPAIGEKLFNGNCASCHFPDREMTGPALKGARGRWIENSSEENFYAYIKNSQAVIASGDAYANELLDKWNTIMTPQNVANEEIDHIFAYVESYNSPFRPKLGGDVFYSDTLGGVDSLVAYTETVVDELSEDYFADFRGLDPASVKTVWNARFNKTNLATKEFEERMPWIHKSCETFILNIYVEHLDKPLYFADSLAAAMTYGEVAMQFEAFAQRRDGRVSGSEEAVSLNKYYEKKRLANAAALIESQTNFWNEQQRKDNHNSAEEQYSQQRSSKNELEIFREEFKSNLEKAKKDLGIPASAPQRNGVSYTATVSTLGWKNIDREVAEITSNRKTGIVSYQGREAEIKYDSWSATIANYESYDKVNVYNIPKTFNSYVKIKGDNGKYRYDLNANLNYQTVILAWTENSIFFFQDKKTIKGEHQIALKPITMDEFKNNVAANLTPVANMQSELKYIEFAQKDQVRINDNKRKSDLKERIEPVIFPCMRGGESFETTVGSIHGDSEDYGH